MADLTASPPAAPRGRTATPGRVVVRAAVALAAAACATGVPLALTPILTVELPYLTGFAGSMVAGYFGGMATGLATVALCALAADWFFLPPFGSFAIADPGDLVGLALYCAISVGTVWLVSRARDATDVAQASDARARGILESISDAFYALSHDWRFTYVNQQAERYFGRAKTELLGSSLWMVMPEKLGTIFERSFRQSVETNVPVQFEALSPVTRKWVDIHAYPSERGLSVFVRDMSERLKAKVGEERMAAILNSAGDAIITVDEAERITVFSRGAEIIFRCTAADAIGQPIARFIPERFRAVHHRHIEEFANTGVSMRQMGGERVLAALRANGEEFPMEARISQSNVGGEKLYTVILRDITDRVRLDRERQRLVEDLRATAEDAERANRAKDEFLATVSHELRTPMTPILTWSRMLRSRKMDERTMQKALETIERAALSQAQLIEDLLDVSRIITGKIRLDVRRIDVATVLQGAIESLRPAAEAKEIRLQTVLDPRAGLVSGDHERLQQVFWNLLSNAIKFTPKGGRVNVVVQRVNSHIEVMVGDTGKGIAPEFVPHVFERFRQDDPTTTRQHGGLGLGLAIVKHLVELHGGTVCCESPGEGQGAVFTVALPLAPLQAPAREDHVHPTASDGHALAAPTLDGLRVLVVDDERDTLEALSVVLTEAGADVRTARSASQGIEVVRSWCPGVIVSDIGMPEQDGFDFIRQLRALPPDEGGRVPALALTAYARVEDRMKVLSAGFQMHVPKPIQPSELVTVVSSVSTLAIRE